MGHIDKNLLNNEYVLKRGNVSFTAYLGPILILILGFVTAIFIIGIVLIVYASVAIARLASIEVAVTNKRVVGKIGIFAKNSLDLRLTKLEGVSVRRGLLGAMFNYGSVSISGSGQSRITFPGMQNPENLRRSFLNASEQADQNAPQTGSVSSQIETQPTPLFEVQVLDRASGDENWIQVKAKDKDDAIRRAADTGMIAGQCRLLSID